ncbi:MAG: SufD family Fe-S cluster assembly protein [Candidatus Babeliales bacterium]|jgi:Fe-S cluster assembly scaffold protein SufB
MMTPLQKLTIYLGTDSKEPLSLRELLVGQIPDTSNDDFEVTIIVAPSIAVTIHDDLASPAMQSIRHAIEFVVHRYGSLTYWCHAHNLASSVTHKEIIFRLIGRNARAHAWVAWQGSGNKKCVIKTIQDHQAEHSQSRIEVRGVLDDTAVLSCTSLIKVAPHAFDVVADQLNKNLMLSSTAHALAAPQLEVENNDVQCRHGAAISTLSEDQLFYLEGRGLSLEHARRMLIQSFLNAHSERNI